MAKNLQNVVFSFSACLVQEGTLEGGWSGRGMSNQWFCPASTSLLSVHMCGGECV